MVIIRFIYSIKSSNGPKVLLSFCRIRKSRDEVLFEVQFWATFGTFNARINSKLISSK